MPIIADFTDQELFSLRQFLTSHYAREVEIQLADCELLLDPSSEESTACPTVFWHASGTNFVIFKTGESAYRAQFFYTPREQYGTDTMEFTQLESCVSELLRIETEHDRDSSAD